MWTHKSRLGITGHQLPVETGPASTACSVPGQGRSRRSVGRGDFLEEVMFELHFRDGFLLLTLFLLLLLLLLISVNE